MHGLVVKAIHCLSGAIKRLVLPFLLRFHPAPFVLGLGKLINKKLVLFAGKRNPFYLHKSTTIDTVHWHDSFLGYQIKGKAH